MRWEKVQCVDGTVYASMVPKGVPLGEWFSPVGPLDTVLIGAYVTACEALTSSWKVGIFVQRDGMVLRRKRLMASRADLEGSEAVQLFSAVRAADDVDTIRRLMTS